jgi:hypothetical protein
MYTLRGALSRGPWPVPLSVDVRELADFRLIYDNDESPFTVDMGLLSDPDSRWELLRKRLRVFVECQLSRSSP